MCKLFPFSVDKVYVKFYITGATSAQAILIWVLQSKPYDTQQLQSVTGIVNLNLQQKASILKSI